MTRLQAHITDCEGETKVHIHPASDESVHAVLNADPDDPDGRSQWLWVRLPNGDLVLGIFPQGETYMACEKDAQWPGLPKKPARPPIVLYADPCLPTAEDLVLDAALEEVALGEGYEETVALMAAYSLGAREACLSMTTGLDGSAHPEAQEFYEAGRAAFHNR